MKSYKLNQLLFIVTGCSLTACGSQDNKNPSGKERNDDSKPNILLIVSEDTGPHLSCYGDTVISTPNLDKIAQSGILFNNAFVTQSVCSPSRSSIFSGMYPHQNGHLGLATHGFHYVGKIDNIYQILKQAGYRTGMLGKLHVNPESDFPIDYRPIRSSNFEKRNLGQYAEYADTFINKSDTPFFLMVNFPDAHYPFHDTVENRPAKTVSPDEIAVFPYVGFENERIRRINANIYNCILRLDECVGELMQKLEASGKADNTLVIYLGDHGCQMARGKIWVYEASVKVPFLAKWTGNIKPGITSDAFISVIDILPTFCDILKVKIPEKVTGKSLLPIFKKPDKDFREFMFVERNSDAKQFHFPQRAIRDKRYKLIYTLLEGRKDTAAILYTATDAHPAYQGTPTLEELESASDHIREVYYSLIQPPKLQLYDLQNDPWEFNNLADDPQYDEVKNRLFNKLKEWQEETDDPLRFPDKLKHLTTELDTIITSAKRQNWSYPEYLYGQ